MTKTYAVNGLIDWQATLPVGKARVNIHFSGGAMTKYGVTPAEYTTGSVTTQRIIEESEYFLSGKIYLLRGRPGGFAAKGSAARGATTASTNAAGATATGGSSAAIDGRSATATGGSSESGAAGDGARAAGDGSAGGAYSGVIEIMEMKCAEDAALYLSEKYSIPMRNLRTIEAINKAAEVYNVRFIIT